MYTIVHNTLELTMMNLDILISIVTLVMTLLNSQLIVQILTLWKSSNSKFPRLAGKPANCLLP